MRFNSSIEWWVPAVIVGSVAGCFVGPMIDGDWLAGIILAAAVLAIEILTFAGVKYEIRGRELGIRNFFRWTWYPIDKISEISSHRSFLSAPALSTDRIAIRFSDRAILKSTMPLEISPKRRDLFITTLLKINPGIALK